MFERLIVIGMGLVGFNFLIFFHELGHFLFCKLYGVGTPTFSLGFGPSIFTRKIGSTRFILSLFPLGGYVDVAGMGEEGDSKKTDGRSFSSIPYLHKLAILCGGVLFNILFAYGALVGLSMAGLPKSPLGHPLTTTTVIHEVIPGKPADRAGIVPGDRIVAVNGEALDGDIVGLMKELWNARKGTIRITVDRLATIEEFELSSHDGRLGVVFESVATKPASLIEALGKAGGLLWYWTEGSFRSLASLLTQRSLDGFGGPLKIMGDAVKNAREGFPILLLFLSFLSLNLAVLNCLPLPILDGGQVLFYSLEAALGRPIPNRIRTMIHLVCWIMFLALISVLTIREAYEMIWARWG